MPDQIVDFSVNLNPLGLLPVIKKKWGSWIHGIEDYPDPYGQELLDRISIREQLPKESILLGNGGAELITLVANMLKGKHVAVIQPTFAEYERMCRAFGCNISRVILEEGKWALPDYLFDYTIQRADALFLCHPNNPTGVCYLKDVLRKLLHACEKHQCYLIVDEAFYDFFDEEMTMASLIKDHPYLIVIRSLTKMYSIAGLRLGYLLASKPVIEKLKTYQPHWSVNAIALQAGLACLSDESFVQKTRKYVKRERDFLQRELRLIGYDVSASQVNFFVLRDPAIEHQLPLIQFLLKSGIVPRHTENFPGLQGRWIRVAVKQTEENKKLLEALRAWKTKN